MSAIKGLVLCLANMERFDAYEMGPCVRIVKGAPRDQWERIEESDLNELAQEAGMLPSDPDFKEDVCWSVYGHLPAGGVEWISDHDSKEEAVTAVSAWHGAHHALIQKEMLPASHQISHYSWLVNN